MTVKSPTTTFLTSNGAITSANWINRCNKIEELKRGKSPNVNEPRDLSGKSPFMTGSRALALARPYNALENLKENLAIGHEVLLKYDLGRVLGKGAHAVVRLATHKRKRTQVAIKTYDKSKISSAHR